MAILVTGVAGFIGYHVAARLLARGDSVVGIDNLNDYYSVQLKEDRLRDLSSRFQDRFSFHRVDFSDFNGLTDALKPHKIGRVAHLGAQAGVRYSLQNPHAYIDSNLVGFVNILEGCRHGGVQHLVFASSSSVSRRWVSWTPLSSAARSRSVTTSTRTASTRRSLPRAWRSSRTC